MKLPAGRLAPVWMAALMLPVPMTAAKTVTIAMCGGTSRTVQLPVNGPVPLEDSHGCCRKACHAGTDRRKKSDLLASCC
ncbi:MAG: hypothetical protein EBS87_02630 [Sphingomonadaceae bacterium]|nr:hypothetical protein [Sphingomonadaceae bacterium]NBU77708.1 hypothetical protein [Sphingomonadaceae bacterium]NCA01078.1 hypothetical protein [Sphingomonadaceae bacterium]